MFGFPFFLSFADVLSDDEPSVFTTLHRCDEKDAVTVAAQKDDLYQELLQKAPEYEVKAQNAKIDHIWKAMPGYNGLKVNIEKSYKKMKQAGEFDEKLLVYDQVKPDVHLESLKPEPIYRGHPDKPMVSFIINVAWGNEYLEEMLPVLQQHRIKATFFWRADG